MATVTMRTVAMAMVGYGNGWYGTDCYVNDCYDNSYYAPLRSYPYSIRRINAPPLLLLLSILIHGGGEIFL